MGILICNKPIQAKVAMCVQRRVWVYINKENAGQVNIRRDEVRGEERKRASEREKEGKEREM
jgi:hypothetical protein